MKFLFPNTQQRFLKRKHNTPSDSFFKHTVYGLRYLFRIFNRKESSAILPSIERPKKLPVVLSEQAFKAKHKVNIDRQIGQVIVEVAEKTASLLNRCPSCKTGELHTVASFDQRGPPANWFNKISKQNNKRQVA